MGFHTDRGTDRGNNDRSGMDFVQITENPDQSHHSPDLITQIGVPSFQV